MLLQAHQFNSAVITAPTYQVRTGHPLLFSATVRPHLKQLREETLGLRQLMKEFHSVIQTVEFNTPDVLVDINTPEIYQRQLCGISREKRGKG